jgi:hypothetical protein
MACSTTTSTMRSADLGLAGVAETARMNVGGPQGGAIFDRCNIVDKADVVEAMRKVQGKGGQKIVLPVSEGLDHGN